MATEKQAGPKPIAQRADIEERYTWDLTDIFADDDAWETEYRSVRKEIDRAREFAGRLAQSPALMYDCLKTRAELSRRLFNLVHYAYLSKDLDNRVSRYQAMNERAAALGAQAGAAFAFIEPELLTIDENKLLEMSGQFEKTDEFDFYVRELIRSRAHVRSEEVEEVLANSAMVSRGPGSIFTMLDDADLTYPTIKDEQGAEVPLTKQRFAKFLESPDRRVRRDASAGFYSAYKDHVNTIGASLTSSVNADVFYTRARRYDNCLHAALDGDNIPLSVYHSLLDTTEANLAALHAYTALRKRILKLDEIAPYDLHCPLFPEQDYEVSYGDAVQRVLQAVQPFGGTYTEQLRTTFDSRWVDVFETQGKGSGAYSSGNYSVHPYVLMNYNDTVDNMFTLAHEMGHAMHSFLACRTQPYPKSHYSIFVAEVASTLNEGLLLELLLGKARDKAERLYLLNRYLDNTTGTFFRQIMYARFELDIHEKVEQGGALSPEIMNKMWAELAQKYFGPELKLDDHEQYKWARIPHFYTGYYVYQYATSYAASQAILDKFTQGEEGIVDRYLELLSAGGRDHPIELLKACGVDMSTPGPVEATIRTFAEKVAEADRLTRE
ncbi:MAG TPA: oligoendopeptidase F [Acidobacteriota bacterium]|nr:oligoendopeptidase F [Acidobacteriota bacterium]